MILTSGYANLSNMSLNSAVKTTAKVLAYMVGDMIRHPFTASTVHVNPADKVYVVREKKDTAKKDDTAVGKSK